MQPATTAVTSGGNLK